MAAAAIESLTDVVRDELNVKAIVRDERLDELVGYTYKPNLKTLGPKYGKRLAAIRNELPNLGDSVLAPLRRGEDVTVTIGGEPLELAPEDVMVGTEQSTEWVTASDGFLLQIALSTKLTPELIREGLARDFIRGVQQLRKDADLEIENRITILYAAAGEPAAAIAEHADTIRAETLADRLEPAPDLPDATPVRLGDDEVKVRVKRV
jgi:isoleucyl-tRNA synthetase